jgi:GTPase SAR1 family protein
MLNITRGIVARPQKVVIYGPEGIGKTTLASQTPDPLFIDTEGGSAHLDVRRIEGLKDWEELLSTVKEVAVTKDICKTLVLDTADWAEQLAIAHILDKYKQPSIEAFGYGKGYTYIGEEFTRLLDALDMVIAGGMNVVVTAHAKMRKFEQPDEMGAYDRWEMKLTRQSAPLLKEWCDLLLFCNYETFVVSTENKTAKAQGGKRVMYTSHHPCWDAKNRHGLPDKLDLDYRYLKPIFALPTGKEQKDEPPAVAPDPLASESDPAAASQQTAAAEPEKSAEAAERAATPSSRTDSIGPEGHGSSGSGRHFGSSASEVRCRQGSLQRGCSNLGIFREVPLRLGPEVLAEDPRDDQKRRSKEYKNK